MKRIVQSLIAVLCFLSAAAQSQKPYDEAIDPMVQIDSALTEAKASDKFVICQVGGNWCRWCLMFADYIKNDEEIAEVIADNYVYIHVNYPRSGAADDLMKRLGNPGRFGYPVMVVLDGDGNVVHIQDSSFLEDGNGYDKKKVLRFFKNWTPAAMKQ